MRQFCGDQWLEVMRALGNRCAGGYGDGVERWEHAGDNYWTGREKMFETAELTKQQNRDFTISSFLVVCLVLFFRKLVYILTLHNLFKFAQIANIEKEKKQKTTQMYAAALFQFNLYPPPLIISQPLRVSINN